MSRQIRKDVQEIIRYAEGLGFTMAGQTGSGHFKLVHPRAGFVIMAQTPSGHRWALNAKSLLRRKLNHPHIKDS
jgi:predicted RNA binding protein YcfA (HicA-like mRNA interferase family)